LNTDFEILIEICVRRGIAPEAVLHEKPLWVEPVSHEVKAEIIEELRQRGISKKRVGEMLGCREPKGKPVSESVMKEIVSKLIERGTTEDEIASMFNLTWTELKELRE
jgi:DNA-binding transcriptional regulator YhcF (GntR family)